MTDFTYHVSPVKITCEDRTSISGTRFSPASPEPCGIVIICPALGVGQSFYHHFAAFLCENHFAVITFDYRGTGESKTGHGNPCLAEWALLDINAVISYAADLPGGKHLFLAGHSVGGQIFCLSEQSDRLAGVILVAASFPFWKRWKAPRKYLMFFFFFIMIPLLGIWRTFPTRTLGLSKENLPSSIIRDWGRWARHPDYVAADKFNMDASRFHTFTSPMLSISFDDDDYVPPTAVERLHREFKTADIENLTIAPHLRDSTPIGHFGFFRKGVTPELWEKTVEWMNKLTV
jgi:predicted alpha/beta hydrolase